MKGEGLDLEGYNNHLSMVVPQHENPLHNNIIISTPYSTPIAEVFYVRYVFPLEATIISFYELKKMWNGNLSGKKRKR